MESNNIFHRIRHSEILETDFGSKVEILKFRIKLILESHFYFSALCYCHEKKMACNPTLN